jgi:multiple sugar transport system substrate-binding protein
LPPVPLKNKGKTCMAILTTKAECQPAGTPRAGGLNALRSSASALLAPVMALFVSLLATAPASAGEQSDRAVATVRQLLASGEIKPDAVLRLRAKQGNLVSLLGRDFALQREWERQTGIRIDASLMPQLDSKDFIRGSTDIDLTVARAHEYADLDHAGLVTALGPLLDRFGFKLADDPNAGYLQLAAQSRHGGKVLAIPADLDIALLFMRRDMLEDPAQRERFRARHGRELAPPRTWAEYEQLVAFFDKPGEGFHGAGEPRERLTAWMYWMPRYVSTAAPQRWLFDEQMRPLIDSPAGIEATRSYAAVVRHSPPQVLETGRDFSYTLPLFVRGQSFSTILTVATAKIANRDDSAVKGKVIAVPMPGHEVRGQLVQRTTFIYGNNLVVPSSAPNKALAVLYAMWLTDPEHSLRSVTANGIADPYRQHHLRDETVRTLYTPQAIDVLAAEASRAVPGGTGLPGDAEYLQALNQNLWLAAAGKLTPREAMQRTAREWEAITNRLGRAKQIAHWRAWRQQTAGVAP